MRITLRSLKPEGATTTSSCSTCFAMKSACKSCAWWSTWPRICPICTYMVSILGERHSNDSNIGFVERATRRKPRWKVIQVRARVTCWSPTASPRPTAAISILAHCTLPCNLRSVHMFLAVRYCLSRMLIVAPLPATSAHRICMCGTCMCG